MMLKAVKVTRKMKMKRKEVMLTMMVKLRR